MNSRWYGEVVATIDMLLSLSVVMIALALLVVPSIPKQELNDRAICSLAIDMEWERGRAVDLDLWTQIGNRKPIGYSRKDNEYLNLVRDDLGMTGDNTDINSERVCGRGFIPAEYTINVHVYSAFDLMAKGPIKAKIIVSNVDVSSATLSVIYEKEVVLHFQGEERTVVRFTFDREGNIIPSSIHDIPKKVRL